MKQPVLSSSVSEIVKRKMESLLPYIPDVDGVCGSINENDVNSDLISLLDLHYGLDGCLLFDLNNCQPTEDYAIERSSMTKDVPPYDCLERVNSRRIRKIHWDREEPFRDENYRKQKAIKDEEAIRNYIQREESLLAKEKQVKEAYDSEVARIAFEKAEEKRFEEEMKTFTMVNAAGVKVRPIQIPRGE